MKVTDGMGTKPASEAQSKSWSTLLLPFRIGLHGYWLSCMTFSSRLQELISTHCSVYIHNILMRPIPVFRRVLP